MDLQTKITLKEAKHKLNYSAKICCLGSCFATHIGEKLNYFKFDNLLNPTGVLFHPIAIETLITRALRENLYTPEEFFKERDVWHHFELHSSLSHPVKETLLVNANKQLELTNTRLKEASHVFITLGTAWVYTHLGQQKIVANCHKIEQQQFSKTLLTVDQIYASLNRIQTLIRSKNPTANLIFTLSPVRHLKDGMVENQRSKAHLLTALHRIIEENKANTYFPSYEILLDELRDYRFYADDMIHPSALATAYIWDKFNASWIDQQAHSTMKKIMQIQQNLGHRPFQVDGIEYRQFLKKVEGQIAEIQAEHPLIQF